MCNVHMYSFIVHHGKAESGLRPRGGQESVSEYCSPHIAQLVEDDDGTPL